MRKLLLAALCLTLGVGGYAIWPVLSAFQLKQAVKAGDAATLERMVHWVPVRASLKASIAELPPATTAATSSAGGFSLWRLVTVAAAPMLADSFIDKYVTPDGISQIQQARRGGWRTLLGLAPKVPDAGAAGHAVTGALDGHDASAPAAGEDEAGVVAKFVAFYQRLVRAQFHSLSQVEFEIADRTTPARRYISQFVLSNFEWKLASVRIVGAGF